MPFEKFEVLLDSQAAKDLKKIYRSQPKIFEKLSHLIDSLPFNPVQGKPLKGDKKGCYSLRYGDYRIIYQIYFQQKIIHIIRIGDRKDIYR